MEYIVIAVLAAAGLVIFLVSTIIQIQKDIARINEALYKIAKQVGVPDITPQNIDEKLRKIIAEQGKVKAVKRYREITGLSLTDAKIYIDNLNK